jgi:F0F1-type ATP synthase epsilon subunit
MSEEHQLPQNPTAADGKQTMYVKVYSPFKTYFDGYAQSVSAVNDTGPFDVLPRHRNFLSLLNTCDLVIRAAEEQVMHISRGILLVRNNEVTVFLDV